MKRQRTIIILLLPALLFVMVGNIRPELRTDIDIEAQGILARVDAFFSYPRGMIMGKMHHVYADGRSFSISVTGYIGRDDFLFKFCSKSRGEQLKVLYSLGGEDIWIYNALVRQSLHSRGRRKYDRILFTNLSYIDLSGASFQTNYNARITGDDVVMGQKARVLELVPILRGGGYTTLKMYVSSKTSIPLRIEYLDRNKCVNKFLCINKTITKDGRTIPVRLDFFNPREQTETILRFYTFDNSVHFSSDIFTSEHFWEY